MYRDYQFEDLKGKIIKAIEGGEVGDDRIVFYMSDGEKYRLIYHQDCCASCSIEDVCGDLYDLIGNELIVAEEVCNVDTEPAEKFPDSYTWTYYKLDTIKGGVVIRYYGSSNGYYSEEATFEKYDVIRARWVASERIK